jgi:hypothetical protein
VVEHRLAKARVAGSNPVSRSSIQSSSQDAPHRPLHHDGGHRTVSLLECFSSQTVQTADIIDVTVASVEEAVRTLHDLAHYTPMLTRYQLDARSGARVFLKCENFSPAVACLPGAMWSECSPATLLTGARLSGDRVASEPHA